MENENDYKEFNVRIAKDIPFGIVPAIYAITCVSMWMLYHNHMVTLAIGVLGTIALGSVFILNRLYSSLVALYNANAFNKLIQMLEKEGTFRDETGLNSYTDKEDSDEE